MHETNSKLTSKWIENYVKGFTGSCANALDLTCIYFRFDSKDLVLSPAPAIVLEKKKLTTEIIDDLSCYFSRGNSIYLCQ